MNARRILTAGAVIIATAAGAGCSGGSGPTLSQFDDGAKVLPTVPPADTAGFIPPESVP